MRVIFEVSRLFALVAVFGLFIASTGCAKNDPEPSTAPSTELGEADGASSTTGGGADVPEAGEDAAAPEGDAPAAEGDAPAAEGDAPAAEGEKPAAE